METRKNVKVQADVYFRLKVLQNKMYEERGKEPTMSDLIDDLLRIHPNAPRTQKIPR
jgi:hypothetical protein